MNGSIIDCIITNDNVEITLKNNSIAFLIPNIDNHFLLTFFFHLGA